MRAKPYQKLGKGLGNKDILAQFLCNPTTGKSLCKRRLSNSVMTILRNAGIESIKVIWVLAASHASLALLILFLFLLMPVILGGSGLAYSPPGGTQEGVVPKNSVTQKLVASRRMAFSRIWLESESTNVSDSPFSRNHLHSDTPQRTVVRCSSSTS